MLGSFWRGRDVQVGDRDGVWETLGTKEREVEMKEREKDLLMASRRN
jgi:hypothetical protein